MDDGKAAGRVEITGEETLSDAWYPLRRYTYDYRRRDGTRQRLRREVYFNGPGVAVLLHDRPGETVFLTRQFRLPAQVNGDPPWLVEVCAGMVEPGDTPEETARKEVEQETGFRLHDLRGVATLYMSPGASAEKLHLFLASVDVADRLAPGGGLREEGEEIEVLEMSLDAAWRMVTTGRIMDAKTILLLQHALLRRAGIAGPGGEGISPPAQAKGPHRG